MVSESVCCSAISAIGPYETPRRSLVAAANALAVSSEIWLCVTAASEASVSAAVSAGVSVVASAEELSAVSSS